MAGEGPALLLLHGWGAAGSQWREFGWIDALGSGRRLIMPDVRGHGRSDKPHEPAAYAMDQLVGDVISVLDAEEIREADVCGYSMGAAIAAAAAVAQSHRVRSLTLGGTPNQDVAERMAIGRSLRRLQKDHPRTRSYRAFAETQPDADIDALGALLEAGLVVPSPDALAAYSGAALVAVGDRDRRRSAAREYAANLPRGRLLEIPGADHMGAFGDARLQAAVRDFLDQVSPRA